MLGRSGGADRQHRWEALKKDFPGRLNRAAVALHALPPVSLFRAGARRFRLGGGEWPSRRAERQSLSMPPVKLGDAGALARVIRDEFRRFDGASGEPRDGRIEPSEVRSVAADPRLSASVRAAARALDARPDLLELWDAKDSGRVKDGFFSPTALKDVLGYVYEPAPNRAPQSFKLAAWNVENFFDTSANGCASGRGCGRLPSSSLRSSVDSPRWAGR